MASAGWSLGSCSSDFPVGSASRPSPPTRTWPSIADRRRCAAKRAGTLSSRSRPPVRSMRPKCQFVDADLSSPARSPAPASERRRMSARWPCAARATVSDPRPTRSASTAPRRQGRIVYVAPSAPPKAFQRRFRASSAIALLRARRSSRSVSDGLRQAAEDQRQGNPDRHRLLHQAREEDRSAACRSMLASLVTNDKPDILATAYAPPEPDYCPRVALRKACCKEPSPKAAAASFRRSRKDDHAWARKRAAAASSSPKRSRNAWPPASISRRAAKSVRGPGRRRAGDPQPRAQPDLSRTRSAASSTRTTTGATAASSPSPATASRTGSVQPEPLEDRPGYRDGGHRRQDLAPGSRLVDPLPRAPMSAPPGRAACSKMTQDRPAHLLPHLWRRLELTLRQSRR